MFLGHAWTPSDPVFCEEYTSGSIQVALSNWEQVNSGPPKRIRLPTTRVLTWAIGHPLSSSHPVIGRRVGGSKWQPVVVTRIFSDISKNPLPRRIRYRHHLKDSRGDCPISSHCRSHDRSPPLNLPACEANCSVAPDLAGLNVLCPSCGQESTATPPDLAFDFQPPAKVPFFKSGKLEILKNHLNKLTSDGELSKSDKTQAVFKEATN